MRIKVVGPCAAGKSTLVAGLQHLGYDACSAAQDHSYVPDMWQRLNPPDVLIYLDVTLEEAHRRGRRGAGWDQAYLDEEHSRLRHARAHCDLYLATDGLTADQVRDRVLDFLCRNESDLTRHTGDE
jgi:deoxyadenosine/deoxycytidine kinase